VLWQQCCTAAKALDLFWDDEKIKRLFFVFRFGGMQVGRKGVRGATQENLSVAAVVVVAVVVVVVMDCFILSQVILLCYHDLRLFLMTPAELDTPIKILLASEF